MDGPHGNRPLESAPSLRLMDTTDIPENLASTSDCFATMPEVKDTMDNSCMEKATNADKRKVDGLPNEMDGFQLVSKRKKKTDKMNETEKDTIAKKQTATRQEEFKTGNENDGGKGKQSERGNRTYKRELTMLLETETVDGLNAYELIKLLEKTVGTGQLLALRPRQNKQFEATMSSEGACEVLEEGVRFRDVLINAKRLHRTEIMVSFMHLPPELPDKLILDKLVNWGVKPILPLKRRFYPGTSVADGTRFLKVIFPKEVASLPYSARFDTEDGPHYCRVIHDKQVKICRLCMNPGHVLRECPEFTCRECLEQGHYARECTASKCSLCKKSTNRCSCASSQEDKMEEKAAVNVLAAGTEVELEPITEEEDTAEVLEAEGREMSAEMDIPREQPTTATAPSSRISDDKNDDDSADLLDRAATTALFFTEPDMECGGEQTTDDDDDDDDDEYRRNGTCSQPKQKVCSLKQKNEQAIPEKIQRQNKATGKKKKKAVINLPLVLKKQEARRGGGKGLERT